MPGFTKTVHFCRRVDSRVSEKAQQSVSRGANSTHRFKTHFYAKANASAEVPTKLLLTFA